MTVSRAGSARFRGSIRPIYGAPWRALSVYLWEHVPAIDAGDDGQRCGCAEMRLLS
jgi:hypothetical protein